MSTVVVKVGMKSDLRRRCLDGTRIPLRCRKKHHITSRGAHERFRVVVAKETSLS